jgi:protein phosphatase
MLRVAEQYAGTDTGLARRANEDSLLARAPLFVVADGMGGAQAGEVASRIAVESFHEGLGDAASPEQGLAAHALAANARIHELSHSNAEQAGMGTTLTAVYVGAREVAIAHVGDSRAYCLRDGELLRLTDDHSLVDELIRQGKLTPEQAEDHPQRSIITRALGPEASVEVDTRSWRARAGDVYLLCSDGLTTMVPEVQLAELLHTHPRLRDAGEALIAKANEAGGRDNITVILLRLEEVGVGDPTAADGQHTTQTGMPALDARLPVAVDDGAAVEQRHRTTTPPPVAARRPRRPATAAQSRGTVRRARVRRSIAALLVLSVLGVLLTGAYVASQSVYFIGTNGRGLVTLFRGVPYELPGGLRLYRGDFVSGVSATTLSATRRHTLLDHSLRSEANAQSLMRSLERGELSE